MLHGLIDDEVRRSFPGLTDEQIYEFYLVAKNAEQLVDTVEIFESDLSHARIVRELGWEAFKEYLRITTGTDELDDVDIVALTQAVAYVRELENVTLYAAIYGAAGEASNKKTVTSRKDNMKKLTKNHNSIEIVRGI